jgi:hypothetical protein
MRKIINKDVEIKPGDTMRMFFKDDERSPAREDDVCRRFNEKIQAIINTGKIQGLEAGQCLCMIAINYKHMLIQGASLWRTIPWGRMEDIQEFISNNAFRFYAMMMPAQHRMIMQQTDAESRKYQLCYNTYGKQGNN